MSHFIAAEEELKELKAKALAHGQHDLVAALGRAVERIETLKAQLEHAEMIGDGLAAQHGLTTVGQLQAIPEGRTRDEGPFMLAHHWLRLQSLPAGTNLYAGPAPR